MLTLDDLSALRPEGIEFVAGGHAITIMPTAKTRRTGAATPPVKLNWQVLSDGNTAGYIEATRDGVLAWKPSELDEGTPATAASVAEAIEVLTGDKKQQHHHNKHPHKKR